MLRTNETADDNKGGMKKDASTWTSLMFWSTTSCTGSIKLCFTLMSKASLLWDSCFIDSPKSSRAPPAVWRHAKTHTVTNGSVMRWQHATNQSSPTTNAAAYARPLNSLQTLPGYTLISLFFRYSTLGADRLNCCHKAECMCIRVVYVKFYSCRPKVAEENRICQSRQHFKCPIV